MSAFSPSLSLPLSPYLSLSPLSSSGPLLVFLRVLTLVMGTGLGAGDAPCDVEVPAGQGYFIVGAGELAVGPDVNEL